MLSKLKIWLRIMRPFTLTASVIPVTIGAVLVYSKGKLHLGYYLLSLIAIVLIHAAVNLFNDHDDFINKVDTEDSLGSSRVIVEKKLSPQSVYRVGTIIIIIAVLMGLFIAYQRGLFILIIGLFGIAAVYSYTGSPFKLKYKGLGLPIIFLSFGPLALVGSYYVQAQSLSVGVILLSIPLGMMTTAILQANDLRDMNFDKRAGIKTLSILLGKEKGVSIYKGLILLSYICVAIMIYFGALPYWSLFTFITLPTAYRNIKLLRNWEINLVNIIELDKKTAQLQAQFGALLIASVLL